MIATTSHHGVRFNPILRAQYERLRAAGKPDKVARCAVARKLMHVAYAVVTYKQACDPHFGEQARGKLEELSRAATPPWTAREWDLRHYNCFSS